VDRPEAAKLVMNTFPAQGVNTNYDLSSVVPDSASTATAIASGHKTTSSVIGMDENAQTSYENIAELAKKEKRKIGILTTVPLNHATPAAFYAHVPNRRHMYDIAMQLASSKVDYFAGGQIFEPTDRKDPGKPDAIETAKKNGFTIAVGRTEFEALKPGVGRVIAMSRLVDQNGAMYFSLDQADGGEHVTIAEYLSKAIELLDNPNGFFIMTEGGKIDWACHANDAATAIAEVLALDEAIARAVQYYEKHPRETLIVVTGDHETGGLAIGFAGTEYSSFVDKLQEQKLSYLEFNRKFAEYKQGHSAEEAKFEDILPLIKESFGLCVMPEAERLAMEKEVSDGRADGASEDARKAGRIAWKELRSGMALGSLELGVLREAFKQSMIDKKNRARDDYAQLSYGAEEPLTVKLTTILDNKAGFGWTSYSHTGIPVLTSALGIGSELFNGYYDQTDIFFKMVKASGFRK
jgi:alkaline phosphatase